MRKCPICDQEMEHTEDILDGWCLIEETWSCKEGHYSDEYWAGTYTITVFDKVFTWTYTTRASKAEKIEKSIVECVEEHKRKVLLGV